MDRFERNIRPYKEALLLYALLAGGASLIAEKYVAAALSFTVAAALYFEAPLRRLLDGEWPRRRR